MSKLGCACGNTIPDQTDNLPYKGHILPDVHHHAFFEWIAQEAQSYVTAVREGQTNAWLLRRFTRSYVDLKLSDADVLNDHICAKFLEFKRDMYECDHCGRIHVETHKDNLFVSYAPDNQKTNSVLSDAPGD